MKLERLLNPGQGWVSSEMDIFFMAGGLSYAALHLGNALISNEPVDGTLLARAGAVALTGIILKKTYRSTVKIGQRYKLHYIPLK